MQYCTNDVLHTDIPLPDETLVRRDRNVSGFDRSRTPDTFRFQGSGVVPGTTTYRTPRMQTAQLTNSNHRKKVIKYFKNF
jgi:hypothetical protein